MYKIGTYKSGQQIAKEQFRSNNLEEIKNEFIRMFEATEFCPEGTDNEPENSEDAWKYKHFCEDTNHVAIFECENEEDICKTNWIYQGMESNLIK
jgi:hypothetical protein